MHRSSRSSNSKGQWFLVSAVVISGAFLAISLFFKDYLVVDQSVIPRMDEDFYFHDIKEALNRTVQMFGFDLPDCINLTNELDEFIYFSKERMAEKGYYLYVTKNVDCSVQKTTFHILLASSRMVVYENVNPEDVLG
jgi:hypothetical protein